MSEGIQLILKRLSRGVGARIRQFNIDKPFYKVDPACPYHGGDVVAKTLKSHGVEQV